MEGKSESQILREQVEFYLGDDNLKSDNFFRERITEGTDGYFNIDFILKCNKVKKLTTKAADIVAACKTSTLVECNEADSTIRRKDNREVPAFEEKKRRGASGAGRKAKKESVILATKPTNTEAEITWKGIKEAFNEKFPDMELEYTRYNETNKEGHISIYTQQDTAFEEVFKGVKVGEQEVEIYRMTKTDMQKFFNDHGGHYEKCTAKIKRARKRTEQKEAEETRKARESRKFKLGEKEFKNMIALRTHFKLILNRTKDDEEIEDPNKTYLMELLKYHPKHETKTKDFKAFTVGIHPEHPESRCFFVVKTDDSKEDFSLGKCATNMEMQTE
mmetsp:Transcript_43387/g.49906  ORF Transcript_43387/g.49906 Transcript_43387/m.49906 type:complete len:332 (+) Transcript_43387:119-1114(+)